jgi:hypothetical protein
MSIANSRDRRESGKGQLVQHQQNQAYLVLLMRDPDDVLK